MARKTTIAGFRPKPLVAVLAFDGAVLGDIAVPTEMLARAGYEVRICSATPEVRTTHVVLRPRWRLASLRRAHTIIVPGVADLDQPVPDAVIAAIERAGARVASICTGAFVLARTGLLDGKRATTHWAVASELARRHPQIEVDADVLYVDCGRVLTSAGAAAAHDLCLHLVRRDFGARAAAELARAAVMPLERAGGQAQFIVHAPPTPDGGSLEPVLAWLARNLARDVTLPAIARRAAMSTRTLGRRFREQTGTTPGQWLIRARVTRARELLETTALGVEEVAAEAGFGSAAALRERFHGLLGTSPQAYRRAFRPAPQSRSR